MLAEHNKQLMTNIAPYFTRTRNVLGVTASALLVPTCIGFSVGSILSGHAIRRFVLMPCTMLSEGQQKKEGNTETASVRSYLLRRLFLQNKTLQDDVDRRSPHLHPVVPRHIPEMAHRSQSVGSAVRLSLRYHAGHHPLRPVHRHVPERAEGPRCYRRGRVLSKPAARAYAGNYRSLRDSPGGVWTYAVGEARWVAG